MKKEKSMKRRLSYIMACVALMCATFTACIDDNIVDPEVPGNGAVKVSLRLVLPSGETPQTRAGGTGTEYGELDPNTTFQKYIGDIWILVFRKDENRDEPVFDGLVENLKPDDNQGNQTRTVEGTYRKRLDNAEIAVLTNLTYNLTKAPDFKSWEGLTAKEIYEKLVYDYPQSGFVLNERRFIPMWGKVGNVSLNREHNEATLDLYRAVAKMGVKVDDGCSTFTLKKVYVYSDNNSGYCAAPNEIPDEDEHVQYTAPDVPDGASQFAIDKPQVYDVTGNVTMEQIYLSEVTNKGNDRPMKVVVGGVYSGEGLVQGNDLSYYRIDMEDTYDEAAGKDNPDGPMSAFDIIRNHSYIFNITDVDHPGTPTPDKALDSDVAKLKVEIQRYTDEPMRGLPDQYTLTTDKSVIQFESSEDITAKPLGITTDHFLGWTIEPIEEGEKLPEWLLINQESGGQGETTIQIKPDNVNHSITREARFYVCAGKIKKEITVIQPQPPTANCYAVGNGDHTLIVGIKGNGTDGTTPEGKNILESGDVSLNPAYIAIIWETKQGLVRLLDLNGNPISNTAGRISKVQYDRNTMSIKYRVNTAGASIGGKEGGNALIGAFDSRGNIVWSWHIWVCPDIIDPQTQKIKEEFVEKWNINDYDVMDRNLGALSNRPVGNNSVASMGLLYQWGRKDPFIGAAYSNDNFTGNGLLNVVHYYKGWGTRDYSSDTPVLYTIQNPTTLIFKGYWNTEGLSSMFENGAYLWGTDEGFNKDKIELGSKTIYDPCPVGYRVPPVNTFVFECRQRKHNTADRDRYVFKHSAIQNVGQYGRTYNDVYLRWYNDGTKEYTTGEFFKTVNTKSDRPNANFNKYQVSSVSGNQDYKSSLNQNWNENLKYIPHKVKDGHGGYWEGAQTFYARNYSGAYVANANYYGFYMNFKEYYEPITKHGDMYALKKDDRTSITWFPLTGAYDPTKGVTFNGVNIEQGSSITVNSFLWTNSSVMNGGKRIPAAMFLHGTEYDGGGSGRHIHGMTQSNIKAEPHYAGAVRCVRDRAKNEWSENSLTESISIWRSKGSKTTITIVSVGSDWMLTDPGAPWLKITPDRGKKTTKDGSAITLTMLSDQPIGTSTVLTFRIAGETQPRKVTVTVR